MFLLTHFRVEGDSLKGTCPTKSSKFDSAKTENSIILYKVACDPMWGNVDRHKLCIIYTSFAQLDHLREIMDFRLHHVV